MAIQTDRTEHPNDSAHRLFIEVSEQTEQLDIIVSKVEGATVLDFAVDRAGTMEAGVRLGEICMGGQGNIEMFAPPQELELPSVQVETDSPLLACIGSQYAGWPISHDRFFAMGSGPMRMSRGKEEILLRYDLHRPSEFVVGVLETNQIPDKDVIIQIAEQCQISPQQVCLCVARTASFPGAVQVVARSIEVAMHKLHELKFDLACIVEAMGTAPLPPIADDDMTALGWTNDAILYGGKVDMKVETTDESIEKILDQIPSCSSTEFGLPFLDIFDKYEKDFYKIDKMLFSPAQVAISNITTGRTFQVGEIRNDVLKQSFGIS